MKKITLSKVESLKLASLLENAGYTPTEKQMYIRFSTNKRGDSVFLHHSLDVIRCRDNTKAKDIIVLMFGAPNGKTPESQDNGTMLSWFFNGYVGKSTTRLN
ncbi:TPA: hypothetical protein NJ815_004411 [Vibrio parahaemolyticus]|nr:hypothetical protein [Vibrio parahaemolyticus]